MPFLKPDDWEEQHFNSVQCPENTIIPINDVTVWKHVPQYRWLYNKIILCDLQGIEHGPHGAWPTKWPVFSKPITNLWGMGMGVKKLTSQKQADNSYNPGHFWMELLTGDHLSLDLVVLDGEVKWCAQAKGYSQSQGVFDYWAVNQSNKKLDQLFDTAFLEHFRSYSGCLNLEIIDGKIIEGHLRFSTQFISFYGRKWLSEVVELYDKNTWNFKETTIKGYNIPVFVDNKINKIKINQKRLDKIQTNKNILDIVICVDKDGDINGLANPPGGKRVALISSTSLSSGLKARIKLKQILSQKAH